MGPDEPYDDPPPSHAPGFEPPTDVNVPWYAWVLWPLALVVGLFLSALLFKGCMSWM
jgi:hypothetical protein